MTDRDMEEIYKPDTKKVEIYSRDSNDMLGDMPDWLRHTGSYIVYGLVALLVAGAALFQYPDTVKKHIRIDDTGSVEWITANRAGMIERFFVENRSQVKENDTLGILKNTASLKDVKRFCQVLTNVEEYYRTMDIGYLQDYPFDLIMGEMTPVEYGTVNIYHGMHLIVLYFYTLRVALEARSGLHRHLHFVRTYRR